MTNSNYSTKITITLVVVAWMIMCGLLYTGTIEMNLVGHIEISAIVSFSVIFLILHLFKIIKNEARTSLHF